MPESADLRQEMVRKLTDASASIASGSFVTSHTGSGHSTTRATAGWQGLNPASIAEHWDNCVELYDRAKADFSAQVPPPTITDALLYQCLLYWLEPCTEYEVSAFMLRYQNSVGTLTNL